MLPSLGLPTLVTIFVVVLLCYATLGRSPRGPRGPFLD